MTDTNQVDTTTAPVTATQEIVPNPTATQGSSLQESSEGVEEVVQNVAPEAGASPIISSNIDAIVTAISGIQDMPDMDDVAKADATQMLEKINDLVNDCYKRGFAKEQLVFITMEIEPEENILVLTCMGYEIMDGETYEEHCTRTGKPYTPQ